MKIKIHSIHFDADAKLLEFIEQKIQKLTVFYEDILSAEVFLRIEKADDSSNKMVEVRLLTPGKELFAKRQCKSFEEATDLSAEALRRQVRKKKGKILQAH